MSPEEPLADLVTRARGTFRPYRSMSVAEKQQWALGQTLAFVSEANACYLEQRAGAVNHRLSAEDIAALWSQARWEEYAVRLQQWRAEPEHDCAYQLHAMGDRSEATEATMDTAPRQPASERLPLPQGCPNLPTPDRPKTWEDLLRAFLRARGS